jgi:Ribosomal protein L35
MLRFFTRNNTAMVQWGTGAFSNLVTSRPVLFGGIITRGMAKSILKTNKAAAKRFRVTGSGHIRRYVYSGDSIEDDAINISLSHS